MIINPVRSIFMCNSRFFSVFKSSIALDTLYPKSSLSITAPVKIPESEDGFSGYIPIEKLDITYSRSSGPGGQHVNKVDTKVDMRFHVQSADWLSENIKQSILDKLKNKINKDGYLVVRSEKTRSQLYNQADAVTTLRSLIRASLAKPKEPSKETLHMLRKRKEKANMERLILKKMHSNVKRDRQSPTDF